MADAGILGSGHIVTPAQFERLCQQSRCVAPLFQKLTLRRRLLVELAASSVVSAATLAACLASRDAVVQRELAGHGALTQDQLQEVSAQGVNRAIRNLAHARKRTK